MRRSYRIRNGTCLAMFGILVFVAGIVVIVYKPLYNYSTNKILEDTMLLEGTDAFKTWTASMHLYFRISVFHVLNPEGVMQGELPNFEERGPYVYDEFVSKQVLGFDEELDEVQYTVVKNYRFNAKKSGNLSQHDEVTIINPAYLGPINMLATFPPSLMNQYGNDIAKLFPDPNTIFVTGKIKDILFDGLPLVCDVKKHKELQFLCNILKTKKPPILRENGKEGVYAYSFFHKMNGTVQGPYTLNRGSKNISQLGDITSVKGKRSTRMWKDKSCNVVKGTDAITWAPMAKRLPRVYSYIEDICRPMWTEYKDDVLVNGLTGWRYVLSESMWEPEQIRCFCPVEKKDPKCLPKGLLDISKCQEAPVIMSEPHFLHGDPNLLQFARNLNPIEEKHFTFVVIDPLTGSPLVGYKKLQLNMKLQKLPVNLLTNVSEGYFPMIWCSSGGHPEKDVLRAAYQAHRTLNIMRFLECVPVILGVFLMLVAFIICSGSKRPRKRIVTPIQDGIIIPHVLSQTLVGRTQRRPKRMF